MLLLVDIFEKIISTNLKYYNLDPCHFFSAPALSWDAMLRMTGVTLEKINDSDKYMFLNKEREVELIMLIKDIVKHLKINKFSILP